MRGNGIRLSDCEDYGEFLAELRQLSEKVDGLDRLTDEKFVKFRTLIDSQADKVALALNAADKAVTKAEVATDKRFDSVNEFRKSLDDLGSKQVSRSEFITKTDAMGEKINSLQDRLNRAEGKGAGIGAVWAWVVGAVGILSAVIVMANAVLK